MSARSLILLPRARAILALIMVFAMVFAAGALVGAAVERAAGVRSLETGRRDRRSASRLGAESESAAIPIALSQLDLTPDQQQQVRAIVLRLRPVTDSIWTALRPKAIAVELQMFQEALCVLTPEQLGRWKAYANRAGATRAQIDERLKLVSAGACPR